MRRALAAFATLALSGCFPPDDGRDPPPERIYFPVGLALSPSANRLYVVNSDFDLQFNAGSLQVYDLESLRKILPQYCDSDADCTGSSHGKVCDSKARKDGNAVSHWCMAEENGEPCGALGEQSDADRLIAPGRCGWIDPADPPGEGPRLLKDTVLIGAFATDVIYRRENDTSKTGRLFVPVRGDSTVHWLDVIETKDHEDSEIDCGDDGFGTACDEEHKRGDDPAEENNRDAKLPPEPFAIAANDDGTSLVVTHQVDGKLSLFENEWKGGVSGGPRLKFVMEGLPTGAVAAASVPEPKIVRDDREKTHPTIDYQPGFLVAFRTSAEVRLVRFFDDRAASPEKPFIEETGSPVPVAANSQGFDNRAIAIDASARKACEDGCGPSQHECVANCASVPLGIFLSNRSPASLLIGETRTNHSPTSSDDLPRFFDATPAGLGASRVVTASVIGRHGERLPRVFVVCFDSYSIYVFDMRGHLDRVIYTGRNPHAFVVDETNGYGYVGLFTYSYVGVIDLDQRHTTTYGTVIASLGEPTPPRASK